jgi:hypothetical protein
MKPGIGEMMIFAQTFYKSALRGSYNPYPNKEKDKYGRNNIKIAYFSMNK